MNKFINLFFLFFLIELSATSKTVGDITVIPERVTVDAAIPERVTVDAAWCWFSDPRAVYHKGMHEKIYYGYINRKGDVRVNSYDLQTGEEETFVLHSELEVDDHNVPTFLFLPDGKLLTFYNHHNGHIFMRRSKYAESVREWEEEKVILEKDSLNRYCYTNPVMLSGENNRIYLFGRNIVRNKLGAYTDTRIYSIYSDDYGETWSKEINLFDNQGRNTPQYVKYASDNKSRIDFLFTDGHPKQDAEISVYHMYYQNGKFWQTNGKEICSYNEAPVVIGKVDKVYDSVKNGVRGWIWDIALDKKNRPVVTYTRYPSEMEHQYYYAKWNGKQWEDTKVTDAGNYITIIKPGKKLLEAHYSGGIVLDHNNPSVVFLSRKIGDRFEIEKRTIGKNGKQKIVPITRSSQKDNLRPYVIYGKNVGKPILMWMQGFYYHYTDYDTDLMIIKDH